MSEDVNQADYCDDDNYQIAIPREERAELPKVKIFLSQLEGIL